MRNSREDVYIFILTAYVYRMNEKSRWFESILMWLVYGPNWSLKLSPCKL